MKIKPPTSQRDSEAGETTARRGFLTAGKHRAGKPASSRRSGAGETTALRGFHTAPMNFEALDWSRLDRLRGRFLDERFSPTPYWQDETDLEMYDATFAERIGWKWDAVLRELAHRGWEPPAGAELWDWGCGSGVAGRRMLAAWPQHFRSLRVTDHSPIAAEFAARRAGEIVPAMPITTGQPASVSSARPFILCMSHVWNELPADFQGRLLDLATQASAVLWVEPGTHSTARALQQVRAQLLARGSRVVAPCTHGAACGLLAPGNERHWCHHFAEPPPAVFADSDWVRFAHRAGIDLRSLPYAFLVLDHRSRSESEPADLQRLLGSPRVYKGFARAMLCGADGVVDRELPKRISPGIYTAWNKGRGGVLYRVTGTGVRANQIEAWPTKLSSA